MPILLFWTIISHGIRADGSSFHAAEVTTAWTVQHRGVHIPAHTWHSPAGHISTKLTQKWGFRHPRASGTNQAWRKHLSRTKFLTCLQCTSQLRTRSGLTLFIFSFSICMLNFELSNDSSKYTQRSQKNDVPWNGEKGITTTTIRKAHDRSKGNNMRQALSLLTQERGAEGADFFSVTIGELYAEKVDFQNSWSFCTKALSLRFVKGVPSIKSWKRH